MSFPFQNIRFRPWASRVRRVTTTSLVGGLLVFIGCSDGELAEKKRMVFNDLRALKTETDIWLIEHPRDKSHQILAEFRSDAFWRNLGTNLNYHQPLALVNGLWISTNAPLWKDSITGNTPTGLALVASFDHHASSCFIGISFHGRFSEGSMVQESTTTMISIGDQVKVLRSR